MSEQQPNPVVDGDGNWYVLTLGLPHISEPLTLAPGVSLRPIEDPLTVFDLAAAGAVGFRAWSILESVAPACVCEIESAKDADISPGYDTLNRAWLASTLLVLRGFTYHLCVACSTYSWSNVAGHQRRTSHLFQDQMMQDGVDAAVFRPDHSLPQFKGRLLDFHLEWLIDDNARTDEVSEEDASWVRNHFDTFNMLAAECESFRFALEASVDWRYAKDARSSVARLWAGIEAMFGISTELVYRISLLSAALLKPRGEERRNKFKDVKRLYGLRSKAVHGEALSSDKMHEALNGSYHLLRDLLLLAIERGHALGENDFDGAVFD